MTMVDPVSPSVDDIPQASVLQAQLDTLARAIDMLQTGGAVPSLAVNPPPPPERPPIIDVNEPYDPGMLPSAVVVTMDPPIDDPQVLSALAGALQMQADAITAQLVEMGYTPSRSGRAARHTTRRHHGATGSAA